MRPFFDNVVIPYLDNKGFKSYGILTQFRKFLREEHRFENDAQFLETFIEYLSRATRTVRGKERPVLVRFDISEMNRPAWPKNLREHLTQIAMHSGTRLNIRHVIRNATLKSALIVFANKEGKEAFVQLAKALGVEGGSMEAYAKGLYKRLYLNAQNLWAGDGLTNQIIGFLSTFFQNYGMKVENGQAEYNPDVLADGMEKAVTMIQGDSGRKWIILRELYSIAEKYIGGIDDAGNKGTALVELGLNMGFDFIDDYSDFSQGEGTVARRQEMLIEVETGLQAYIESEGTNGNLYAILSMFLGLGRGREETKEMEKEETEEMEEEGSDEGGMELDLPERTDRPELLWVNNCLINAIAQSVLGRVPTDQEIIDIRQELRDANVAEYGDLLDGGDAATILIITQTLGIDVAQNGLEILTEGHEMPAIYGQGVESWHRIRFDPLAQHFYAAEEWVREDT